LYVSFYDDQSSLSYFDPMLHCAAKSLANKFVVFKNTAQEVEFKECR